MGTFILFSGRLGDVFGYKRLLLIGWAWFSLWSAAAGCAIYSNYVLFIFSRVLQGIGPAICLPNGLAILGATYAPGRRKAMCFAIFGAMAPAGFLVGALFASLFSMAFWPWAFWAFAIALAGLAVAGIFIIPDPPRRVAAAVSLRDRMEQLDIPGAVTGVAALVLFNFAWNQAPIDGWQAPHVIVMLILGVLLGVVFFILETRYSPQPLIPFEIFSSDVSFVLAALALGWSCFGVFVYYLWQFEEVLLGATPLLVTARFTPVAISGTIAAVFTGMLLHRLGPAVVMTMALTSFTVGSILSATVPQDQTYWAQVFVTLLVISWGMDMSFPAATLILSDAMAKEHQGIAASLVNTVVNYSISLGLGLAGTVEVHVNKGGKTRADLQKGYHGAQYVGIGLAGLGTVVCCCFLLKEHLDVKWYLSKEIRGITTQRRDSTTTTTNHVHLTLSI